MNEEVFGRRQTTAGYEEWFGTKTGFHTTNPSYRKVETTMENVIQPFEVLKFKGFHSSDTGDTNITLADGTTVRGYWVFGDHIKEIWQHGEEVSAVVGHMLSGMEVLSETICENTYIPVEGEKFAYNHDLVSLTVGASVQDVVCEVVKDETGITLESDFAIFYPDNLMDPKTPKLLPYVHIRLLGNTWENPAIKYEAIFEKANLKAGMILETSLGLRYLFFPVTDPFDSRTEDLIGFDGSMSSLKYYDDVLRSLIADKNDAMRNDISRIYRIKGSWGNLFGNQDDLVLEKIWERHPIQSLNYEG